MTDTIIAHCFFYSPIPVHSVNCIMRMQEVTVQFEELELEKDPDCVCDKVILYAGDSDKTSPLGEYCDDTKETFTSYGPTMFVVFHSDVNTNAGRFALRWTCK